MPIVLTLEQEIEALKYARSEITSGFSWTPYICVHLADWCREQFPQCEGAPHKFFRGLKIVAEVEEFLDGNQTVDSWLQLGARSIANQFRIAIIDTLLARRGVY